MDCNVPSPAEGCHRTRGEGAREMEIDRQRQRLSHTERQRKTHRETQTHREKPVSSWTATSRHLQRVVSGQRGGCEGDGDRQTDRQTETEEK